jgi:hypothetical protein
MAIRETNMDKFHVVEKLKVSYIDSQNTNRAIENAER